MVSQKNKGKRNVGLPTRYVLLRERQETRQKSCPRLLGLFRYRRHIRLATLRAEVAACGDCRVDARQAVFFFVAVWIKLLILFIVVEGK